MRRESAGVLARRLPTVTPRLISAGVIGRRFKHRRDRGEELELIERLAREQRVARASGTHVPAIRTRPRW